MNERPIPSVLEALRELARQVEIGNAVDDHGHELKHLAALRDARAVLAEADARGEE